ncbi:MAG: phosphotransferase [Lachnospiraceae bacterium]|nr:phosphotransferase [Lachnospiraceae bacterium]
MNDWGMSVLSCYPLTVRGTRKVRGALLCDTAEGSFLLQEYHGSEKRLWREAQILNFLREKGGYLVDSVMEDREGKLLNRNDEGTGYIMKRWYLFPECSVGNRNDICQAIRFLAKLHLLMRQLPEFLEPSSASEASSDRSRPSNRDTSLLSLYEKHTRELHRVRAYLHRKKKKSELEEHIMKSFSTMYGQAESAMANLKQSPCLELTANAEKKGWVCHGSYHQHNVLIGSGQIAAVNFEHYGTGLQLTDLYQFMRKVLEKHNWNQELGRMMLEEYQRILPLEPGEKAVLYAMFEYPEKYWKQINFYFNGNKAWTAEKNVEKLKIAVSQAKARERFLQIIR